MKHNDGRFTGAAGRSIYFQCWAPEVAPKAVLLVAHGAGEHSARYRSLAQFFTGHNFVVAALDHSGHGYSEGIPGHIGSFDDYLTDLSTFHRQISEQFTALPVILLGHSMGGLIACNYLLRHQAEFVGAVLSGPAIMTDLEPGFVQMSLLRLLAVLMPWLGMLKLDPAGVSRDPKVVEDYIADPLVHHGKMSACMLRELFSGMHMVQTKAADITLPILILHGGEDAMTSPQGSRFLQENIGSSDKTLKIYPQLYHEIFNEPERAQVLDDVLTWCEAHLAGV
ncbi:Monoacylglycerol lipase [Halioglobus japonicus]|nr:Monoacylglycerol lipase [Halioglobus japonicus]